MQRVISSDQHARVAQSSELELLTSELRSHMNDWRSTCEIAKERSAKENPSSDEEIGYWVDQLKALEAIELLLSQAKLSTTVLNWTSVDEQMPPLEEHLITSDEVYLVKNNGRVMAAKLYAGKPLPDQGEWLCSKE
ncbi:MAG: hypothetical protein GX771_05585, partial [Halomonadaceae bacterium]|nr:hypothetical protein [Halomonadaceae bacterium]